MITLHLRYTIDPNKLSDIRAYVETEMKPISESGGSIVGYKRESILQAVRK
jgi:hypothetical protein